MKILYADKHITVAEKPGGLLSVPGRGPEMQNCAAAMIRQMHPDCIAQPAVHRLDMDTSGLMVFALTTEAHRDLSRQFMERTVSKKYIALLDGEITAEGGRIKLAFRLDPGNRPYQVFDPEKGKIGISCWRNLGVKGKTTRIEFIPITGRTHQLRLHASHKLGLGCPIIGDRLYGTGKEGDQLMLHSSSLSFKHPQDGNFIEFQSFPPF